MATLVKRITWDKIKVGDRIRVEDSGDSYEFTVTDLDGHGVIETPSGVAWQISDADRVYRLKEDN